MRRREFIGGMTLPLLISSAGAQAPAKIWRIGVLIEGAQSTPTLAASPVGGFLDGMEALGYREGTNFILDVRRVATSDQLPEAAVLLVAARVDLILAVTTRTIDAAKAATSNIPIVMVLSLDPVASGFVRSLAKPGSNITGMTNQVPDYVPKLLELVRSVAPSAQRVGILANQGAFRNLEPLKAMEEGARQLGMTVAYFEAWRPEHIDRAFGEMAAAGIEVVMAPVNPPLYAYRATVAERAIQNRLLHVAGSREEAESGALLSYGISLRRQFGQVAKYVDKIIKGASPADLPVEQPIKFDIVVNLKTAKALGLTIPDTLLTRADEVIE